MRKPLQRIWDKNGQTSLSGVAQLRLAKGNESRWKQPEKSKTLKNPNT